MVDLKYHLLTLTAVFLALTLGIFIGTALPGPELIWGEQQNVIADLKATFSELKSESSAQKAELAALRRQKLAADELGRCAFPVLVKDRLNGKRAGLIVPAAGTADALAETLTIAGAEVSWEFAVGPAADRLAQAEAGRAAALYLLGETKDAPWPGCTPAAGAPAPVEAVVLYGPIERAAAPGLAALCRTLKGRDIRVIGAVATSNQENSFALFQEWQLSGVDNADTPAGSAALVALLQGAQGYFGWSPAAAGFLPPLVSEWGQGG